MTRRRRSAMAASCVAVLALLAASCSIPTQSGPSAIASSRVPFHLLDPHQPTTTTTQPKPASLVPVKVFYLNADANNQLSPVVRYVSAPAPLAAIIDALLAGPSSGESAAGLGTAIPSDVRVLSATSATSATSSTIVTVDFNSAFGEITGTAIEQAVAQVVSTVATEEGLGTGVVFEIQGQRTSVPVANGSQVAGPVYLIEFLDLAP